jgi:hypothetical protein
MIKVRIREYSWIARLAAKKLGFSYIAMGTGKTIHLYNVSRSDFLKRKRWVIHELKHVDQFRQYGWLRFLWLYLKEYMQKGYYNNCFEKEARLAEADESLLKKYDVGAI